MRRPCQFVRLHSICFLLALVACVSSHPSLAVATWTTDGVPLGPARTAQVSTRVASDGAGGVIIVWQDARNCLFTNVSDIYAQRINASGTPLWGTDGITVCTATGAQSAPQVVSDMAGGAIVFWQDNRSGNTDIYAQRLAPTGAALWTPDGIPICTEPSEQTFRFRPLFNNSISDGSGGAWIAWHDARPGFNYDIYVQHVKDSGAILLPARGLPVSVAPGDQDWLDIAEDGFGGALIAWNDTRSPVSGFDIYAQRVSAAGTVLWTVDGEPVCTAAGTQWTVHLDTDGAGGAILTWPDGRVPGGSDIYAQRLDASGTSLWTPDGIGVTSGPGDELSSKILSDGVGGAIIEWTDFNAEPAGDVRAQRLDAWGTLLWPGSSGITVCDAMGEQGSRRIVPDGAGGAIVTWYHRPSEGYYDLYAQRISAVGDLLWAPGGAIVGIGPYWQHYDDVVSDGSGRILVGWEDMRSGPGFSSVGMDIYANHVDGSGNTLWSPGGQVVAAPGAIEQAPAIVRDDAGGAVVAWEDYRTGCDGDIRVQRVDAAGEKLWGLDGAVVCDAAGSQQLPQICSIGSGSTIVAWIDYRNGNADIYAQNIASGAGGSLWAADGVPVCIDTSPQAEVAIVATESDGAIIVWKDQRGGISQIYAQRLTEIGVPAPGWPVNGMPVAFAPNAISQRAPQVISDGANGCIVTWQDRRNGTEDIYVERIDQLAVRRWLVSGQPLCTAIADQVRPRMISDGAGGAIVTWEDNRSGSTDIAARRVDSTGTPLWVVDGVPIYGDTFTQARPAIASDGTGGAIITWQDKRSGAFDVYAQRVNAIGAWQWPLAGVPVCAGAGPQEDPVVVADEAGGALIAWRDARSGQDDIYVQRLDHAGLIHCSPCGTALCLASGQQFEQVITADGDGGAIVAWTDDRSNHASDQSIYAMRTPPECGPVATAVEGEGSAPVPVAVNRVFQNVPNPFNPMTVISYELAARGHVRVDVFDISGRLVRVLVDAEEGPGPHRVRWDGEFDSGVRAASGAYFYRVTFPGGVVSTRKMMLLK